MFIVLKAVRMMVENCISAYVQMIWPKLGILGEEQLERMTVRQYLCTMVLIANPLMDSRLTDSDSDNERGECNTTRRVAQQAEEKGESLLSSILKQVLHHGV